MNRVLRVVLLVLGVVAVEAAVMAEPKPDASRTVLAHPSGAAWSHASLADLKRWVAAMPDDGLPVISTAALDAALAGGEAAKIDDAATLLALRLAKLHLLGDTALRARSGWNILDTDSVTAFEPLLMQALASGTLETYFATLRPAHHDYAVLKAALATETDRARRQTIARNMERWRWMPRKLSPDHVLVNTARFDAELWRGGEKIGTWRIIVGKKSTPTPIFGTRITGVVLNPWWEIPSSIVRESVGALVRRNPAAARARGYVWGGGRYRQRPGPNNALGQMKLVMANPYSVYMHDTPNKQLFEEKVRAFSHGCVRTDDAIGYAARLLEGVMTRERVDQIVASGVTTTASLSKPLPVYIAYFTATANPAGGVHIHPDIYDRDGRINVAMSGQAGSQTGCALI